MTNLVTPCLSLILGAVSGFYYRDELFMPTNMRIKVALLEYHMLTRQKLDMDLVDIIDPGNQKLLSQRSRQVIERHEAEINRDYDHQQQEKRVAAKVPTTELK
jgi:hypothetical protein